MGRHRHACCDGVNDVPALAAALRTLQRAFAAELTPAQAAAAAAGARARRAELVYLRRAVT
ncbi:hypothetical protein JNW91_02465 [Micromonospora sp. STR1_7]|uniref:Uncharacterized protein n=1 Tax=Micromonospora parastrephiae TaxID=2806101 RepID=A0ABS1XNK5_9ACTN|nr:hypothetical protein [Micromonospora parastrephiae]MBM0230838.1 hypothetical protein [Micromonospora parastrephiae]